jgi:hypothetical protein
VDLRTEQSLAADGAIACFSSSLVPLSLDADRTPQLKASVIRLSLASKMRPQPVTERLMIKRFCEERKIVMLLHFTRLENLNGILREGLVCRKELEGRAKNQQPIFCDRWRHWWYKRANCLSVSFPNDLMFCKYRKTFPTAKWVVLKIKPSVLWELDCGFCFKNAWSDEVKRIGLSNLTKLKSYESLLGLFGGRSGKYPADRQAEVLVFNRIEFPEYIEWVYFRTREDREYWKNKCGGSPNVPASVAPTFFGFR